MVVKPYMGIEGGLLAVGPRTEDDLEVRHNAYTVLGSSAHDIGLGGCTVSKACLSAPRKRADNLYVGRLKMARALDESTYVDGQSPKRRALFESYVSSFGRLVQPA